MKAVVSLQPSSSLFYLHPFSLKCRPTYFLDCTLSDFDIVLSISDIVLSISNIVLSISNKVLSMSGIDLLYFMADCLSTDIFPSETGMEKEEDLAENLDMLFSFQSRTVVFEQPKLKKIKHPCRQMSAVDR